MLVRDTVASTFSIVYGNSKCGKETACKKTITVFVEDFVYEIDTDGECVYSFSRVAFL